jgi:fatty-acyl-CoA synthase
MIVSGSAPKRYRWMPRTIAQQLDLTAAEHGHREAIVAGGRRLTWTEVRDAARGLARGLMAVGIQQGDHIAVWLPNQPEWILTWFAATYAGAVVVPVNTRYKTEEVRYILGQSEARMLVMRESFLGIDYLAMLHDLCPGLPETGGGGAALPGLRSVVLAGSAPPGARTFAALKSSAGDVSEQELDERAASVDPEDRTIIVYTSGTTGHPKGAMHGHRILRNECSIAEYLDIDAESRALGHMPFYHVAGGFSAVLPALITGSALVLMERWDPTEALELIERERISVLGGTPTQFIDLLRHPRRGQLDLSSLRTGWIGGATNPRAVIEGVIGEIGMKGLLPVYGMTETTSVTTYPHPDDPLEVRLSGKGAPISDFEVKVIDTKSGAELDAGGKGEICVRGHVVMQGYYNDPEATGASIDPDGWFHTKDLGVLDEKGYLSITGRVSDMFIVGGSNAYPAEIEAALSEHPDIVQACVVGAPDDRLGEVGYAFVECRPEAAVTEQDIISFCKGRLANYKVPRRVMFLSSWPQTATGKVQRFRLKEMAAERPAAPDA